jgi:hypothetical protein
MLWLSVVAGLSVMAVAVTMSVIISGSAMPVCGSDHVQLAVRQLLGAVTSKGATTVLLNFPLKIAAACQLSVDLTTTTTCPCHLHRPLQPS